MHRFPNGKVYIGITKQTVEERWRNGEGYKTQLVHRAIEKYGWGNIEHIVLASCLSKKDAEQLLSTTNAIMRENLMAGKAIQLQGLGVLEIKERQARIIVHPRTGERTTIPSKNQLVFRPVANMKDELKKV